ncbi:DUF1704 domain-containing protein [archaeon]|nr:DUF1704 domain-containing protein [archaeon]
MDLETKCIEYIKNISNTKSVFVLDPINQNTEKIKFFKNKNYNPILKYEKKELPKTFFLKIKQLPNNKYPKLSYFILKNILEEINLRNSCTKKEYTKNSIDFYGVPSENLVSHAKKILKKNIPILEEKTITPQNVVCGLNEYLKSRKLTHWVVKTASITAKAITIPTEKTLKINNKLLFSKNDLIRLKVHEIDTHIMRVENSMLQSQILHFAFPNYLSTEEGLALYSEEMNGVLDQKRMAICAGRVLAVNLALNHSFAEVFEALTAYFDDNDAWDITLRVKRGLTDTSMPGGYTKDYIYLNGYFKIKKYVESGGSIKDLYVAKIGINDLSTIKDLKEIKPPKYLPEYLKI